MTEEEFHGLFEGLPLTVQAVGERNRVIRLDGDDHDEVIVHCTLSSKGTFVSVFSTAVEAMVDASPALLRRCLELNEETWQGKFSLSKSGTEGRWDIDFQFEIPSRLVDGQQLEDAVLGCAAIVSKYRGELGGLARS